MFLIQAEHYLDHMKHSFQHVLRLAPIRLLKLEFTVPEDKFKQSVEMAEVALQQQQEQIRRNQNVKEALAKHKVRHRCSGCVV